MMAVGQLQIMIMADNSQFVESINHCEGSLFEINQKDDIKKMNYYIWKSEFIRLKNRL